MLKSLKRYELNQNISIDKLKESNFKIFDNKGKESNSKYYLKKHLVEDIILQIEIEINKDGTFSFNDINNISVFYKMFGERYYPFYMQIDDKYLHEIILKYNEKMDELVSNGILKEQEQIKLKRLINK